MNIDKENELRTLINARLSSYPRTLLVGEIFEELIPDVKRILPKYSDGNIADVKEMIRKTIESTQLYKMNSWGNYTLIQVEQPKPVEVTSEKPAYVPKASIKDILREMEEGKKKRVNVLDYVDEPQDQQDKEDEEEVEIAEIVEEKKAPIEEEQEEKQEPIVHTKTFPMYLIELVQFAIDEQPKSSRGASFIVNREDHNKLLTDLMQLYRGQDEDPDPEDVAASLKLWIEECLINIKDEITKSQYRAFAKSIVRFYYNTYNNVDEALRKMLDAL